MNRAKPSIRNAWLAWMAWMALGGAPCGTPAGFAASPSAGRPSSEQPPAAVPTAPPPVRAPICEIRVSGYDQTRPADSRVEPSPAVLAGALVYTRVHVNLDEVPLSTALNALARSARVNLLGLYRRNDSSPGLDRDAPISLVLEDVTAQEALEAILAAATGMVDVTWQIRGNIIECGPKQMLAEAGRREIRVYDLTDLRFEVPNFSSPTFDPSREHNIRRRPKQISADFAKLIVNQVEPDAWREADAPGDPGRVLGPVGGGASPTPPQNLDPDSDQDIYVRGQWASLHIRSDRDLVVNAPDFIHRQIGGYGRLVPPALPAGASTPPSPSTPARP